MSNNINDFFPSRWLKASDLKGREPVVVIKRVVREEVGQKKEMKPIVYFDKVEKGLVLNKTNANRITQIAKSGIVEDWLGVSIKLYATEVEFQGEMIEAIRVKPAMVAKVAVKAEPTPGDAFENAALETAREVLGADDDIPF